MDILDLNQNANPCKNYEILHSTLDNAKEIHMPSKTVKFNKRKHFDNYNKIKKYSQRSSH